MTKSIQTGASLDKPKRGRPTEIKRDITKTSQSGLREGLTRATFIIREDTLDKLKERAYTDRKKLKDLVTEALDYYLDNKLKTNSTKETTKMKKLSINPQVKGALKLVFVFAVLGAAFYLGTQYQEQYHQKVTTEAVQIVAQLKANAQ